MRAFRFPIIPILALCVFFPRLELTGQDVSDFEKRMSRINEQIKDIKAKIQGEEKKESSILSSLAQIGLKKTLIRREIEAYAVLFEKTNSDLKGLKDDIARQKAKLEREKQAIEKTLVTLYKFGRFDFLQFMFKVENIESVLTESKHLTYLARYQETVISGYLAALSELGASEGLLKDKQKEISGILLNSGEKKKELEAEEKKNRTLVDAIRRNKETFKQTLEELDESAKQLQALIKKINSQEFTLPFPFLPLYEKRGNLSWPIEGKIITHFGRQKHHRFNTMTMNNGIEIVPKKDRSVIQSIHTGRIVYADPFEGYGNLIIVDHGMTYYSLYGHCSAFLANKGDAVKAGQPIALVGDTGSLKGACLYFEIRFKTRALDPLQWLKRR